MITGTGTIKYTDLEGGFYVLEASDGKTYNVIDLPVEFKENGLRVAFKVKEPKEARVSFQMRGQLVEFVEMSTL
jgi:hypothetical protein